MVINDTLLVVTGFLHPTPLDNLPILAGIQPAELHWRHAMPSLSRWTVVPDHLLYRKLADPAKQPQQLCSWYPFVTAAKQFLRTIKDQDINVVHWVHHVGSAEWPNSASRLRLFVPIAGPRPLGLAMPRLAWRRLNHLWNSFGLLCSFMHKWGMPLQWSVSVAWSIKLQTILYKDANTRHQMASVVCRY